MIWKQNEKKKSENLRKQQLVNKNTHAHAMCVENWNRVDGYPKLPLHKSLETSEKVKSGMGSMGWKVVWYIWEEWGPWAPPTELGKQEEEEDNEDRDWGFGFEVNMMVGWDTAEDREGRGRLSRCPNEWLRDSLKKALDLDGYGVPSPCCPAKGQLSTNLWEPMASWGSMWRWRRDIILGAVGTKQQHYHQPLMKSSLTDRIVRGDQLGDQWKDIEVLG